MNKSDQPYQNEYNTQYQHPPYVKKEDPLKKKQERDLQHEERKRSNPQDYYIQNKNEKNMIKIQNIEYDTLMTYERMKNTLAYLNELFIYLIQLDEKISKEFYLNRQFREKFMKGVSDKEIKRNKIPFPFRNLMNYAFPIKKEDGKSILKDEKSVLKTLKKIGTGPLIRENDIDVYRELLKSHEEFMMKIEMSKSQ
jgi:hypothetical protein